MLELFETLELIEPLELIGWIGGILLAICGIPQAYKSLKQGHSTGISASFLWLWFWGEVLVLIYVVPQLLYPLIFNYLFNIMIIGIILWYKYIPRK